MHPTKRGPWTVLLLLALCVAPGCGTDHQEMVLKQMEELQREISQLKASSAHSAVMMEDLQNKLLLMEDQVESNQILLSRAAMPEPVLPVVKLSPPGRPAVAAATAYPQTEPVREEPTGRNDVPVVEFAHINEYGQVLDGSGRMAETRPAPVVEKGPAPAAPSKRKRFDSRPIELYKHAFALLQKKEHQNSIDAFSSFLEQYPNHDYSDNALYWMGEAYYDVQNYGKALECFQKVVTLFPSGNKVPDALLKSGLCYANSGDPATAREVMGQLLAAYPATRAATIAQQKLQALP